MTFVRPNKSIKHNQTDEVMTREDIAMKIIDYFKPYGKILEPCRGTGNIFKYIPNADWCEINEGRDFFDYDKKVDWIITNPPYSIYDKFLLKCFETADNVVLLVPLTKAFKSQKIDKEIQRYGGLKEVVMLGSGGSVGFPFGFPVGCLHYQRNYKGDIKLTRDYK
jgi:hypothetical protein